MHWVKLSLELLKRLFLLLTLFRPLYPLFRLGEDDALCFVLGLFFQGSGHGFWFLKAAAASYDAVVTVVSAFPIQTPIFWDLLLACQVLH